LSNFSPTVSLKDQATFLNFQTTNTNLFGKDSTSLLLSQINDGTVNIQDKAQALTNLKKDPLVSAVYSAQ